MRGRERAAERLHERSLRKRQGRSQVADRHPAQPLGRPGRLLHRKRLGPGRWLDGAAPVELLLLVGVLLAPELAFLLELQALSPSAAIATMLIAAT